MTRLQRSLLVWAVGCLALGLAALVIASAVSFSSVDSGVSSDCLGGTSIGSGSSPVPSLDPNGTPSFSASTATDCLPSTSFSARLGFTTALTAAGVVALALAVVLVAGFVATLVARETRGPAGAAGAPGAHEDAGPPGSGYPDGSPAPDVVSR